MLSRKMKVNLIAVGLTLFISTITIAGNQFNEYLSKYNKIKSYQAKFIQQKHISIMAKPQFSKGYIKFKKEDKLIWALEKPYSYKLIMNGQKIIKDYPQLNERKIYNINENKQLKAIFDNIFLLMGLKSRSQIEKTYKVSVNKSQSITLIPKTQEFKKYVAKIILTFNHEKLVRSIQLIEASGDYTVITFNDVKINEPIPDSDFSVD